MTFTPVTVTLNGFLFDSLTPDADGILWSWQALDGWFDTATIRQETAERASMGMVTTVARTNARAINLTAIASAHTPGMRIDDLMYRAMRRLKASCNLSAGPGDLVVAEPGLSLKSSVRLASPILSRMFGHRHGVTFSVPLIAQDPRRYNATPQTVATSASFTATNNGDLPSAPVFTVTGPSTNPSLRDSTLTNTPFVRFNGSVAGGAVLTIDFQKLTADVDGLNVLSLLDGNLNGLPDAGGVGGSPPAWWQLAPGANALHHGGGGTGSLVFADAYS